MNLPADVANQALDAAGVEHTLGDLQEGTRVAQVTLRAYGQCLRQLLRAANWDFARKTSDMVLLADATGQSANVGSMVPTPWIYEYAYPIDCMKVRLIPWNYGQDPGIPTDNIQIPATIPLTTATGQPPLTGQRLRPARFVVATDPNYPPDPGQITWVVQGESPAGRTVILTNVKNAKVIYTALMIYPSVWDSLFREAMVAYLASQIALPLAKMSIVGPKAALQLRKENIELAKMKIKEARVVDGNEGISSSDLSVDWMRTRNVGGRDSRYGYGDDGAPGGYGGGWDQCSFADGTAF
jgi:hypothetical protein